MDGVVTYSIKTWAIDRETTSLSLNPAEGKVHALFLSSVQEMSEIKHEACRGIPEEIKAILLNPTEEQLTKIRDFFESVIPLSTYSKELNGYSLEFVKDPQQILKTPEFYTPDLADPPVEEDTKSNVESEPEAAASDTEIAPESTDIVAQEPTEIEPENIITVIEQGIGNVTFHLDDRQTLSNRLTAIAVARTEEQQEHPAISSRSPTPPPSIPISIISTASMIDSDYKFPDPNDKEESPNDVDKEIRKLIEAPTSTAAPASAQPAYGTFDPAAPLPEPDDAEFEGTAWDPKGNAIPLLGANGKGAKKSKSSCCSKCCCKKCRCVIL